MILMLQMRDYGKPYTTEIHYDPALVSEFRCDVRRWVHNLRYERSGRKRGDDPIIVDILIIR